jgi:hypothetical protein
MQRIIEEMKKGEETDVEGANKELEQALKDKDKKMEQTLITFKEMDEAMNKEMEEAMNAKGKEMEEAMNAKDKEMEEALNAKDKELKEARENCSLEKLFNTFDGLPPLDVNTHPQPPKGSKEDNKNKEEKSFLKGSKTGQEPSSTVPTGSEGAEKQHLPADMH